MRLRLIGIALVATLGFAQRPGVDPAVIWGKVRHALIADGDSYFAQIKGGLAPGAGSRFSGIVVSQPSPNELIVNVDDPEGDAALMFLPALNAAIAAGTPVHFQGVVQSYTKKPYRLTLALDGGDIDGLPAGAAR